MLLRSTKLHVLLHLIKKKIYEEGVINIPTYRWGNWGTEALLNLLVIERNDFGECIYLYLVNVVWKGIVYLDFGGEITLF